MLPEAGCAPLSTTSTANCSARGSRRGYFVYFAVPGTVPVQMYTVPVLVRVRCLGTTIYNSSTYVLVAQYQYLSYTGVLDLVPGYYYLY